MAIGSSLLGRGDIPFSNMSVAFSRCVWARRKTRSFKGSRIFRLQHLTCVLWRKGAANRAKRTATARHMGSYGACIGATASLLIQTGWKGCWNEGYLLCHDSLNEVHPNRKVHGIKGSSILRIRQVPKSKKSIRTWIKQTRKDTNQIFRSCSFDNFDLTNISRDLSPNVLRLRDRVEYNTGARTTQ